MRDRASRVLGYAVLASLLLHALIFYVVPAAREFAALLPAEPEPLIARVEQLEPPPAPPAPVAKTAPRPVAPPAPQAPRIVAPAAPAPVAPAPQFAPQPEPAPAPAPAPRSSPPPVAVAPSPDTRAVARFRQGILDVARRDKRYPRVAVDNAWEGAVAVQMAVGADGRIAELRVTRSSGHAVLDREALRLFESAQSRVPIPRELRGQAFEIGVEVVYDLRAQRSG